MKKLFGFFKSMRCGLILLILIIVLSLIGTVISQGETPEYYTENFGNFGSLIVKFGFDHIYSAWYFILVFGFLCVNMLFCSILRGKTLTGAIQKLTQRAKSSDHCADVNREWLKKFRKKEENLYVRHTAGLYGSFVTHLGLLMLLISAGCVLAMQSKIIESFQPGKTYTLQDGRTIEALSFSMTGENGETDYRTTLKITDLSGEISEKTVAVNYPLKFGPDKVFQDSYNYGDPSVDVQISLDDIPESMVLKGETNLTLDGVNGITYHTVFPYVEEDKNGMVSPVMTDTNAYHPGFLITKTQDDESSTAVVYPDTTIDCGGFYCTFRAPAPYPILCIRSLPQWALPLLYLSFAILLTGLFLCFMLTPLAVYVEGDKMKLAGKPGADLSVVIFDLEDE